MQAGRKQDRRWKHSHMITAFTSTDHDKKERKALSSCVNSCPFEWVVLHQRSIFEKKNGIKIFPDSSDGRRGNSAINETNNTHKLTNLL